MADPTSPPGQLPRTDTGDWSPPPVRPGDLERASYALHGSIARGAPYVSMMPGENPLELALRTWEANVNDGGWDQDPRVCITFRTPLGFGMTQLGDTVGDAERFIRAMIRAARHDPDPVTAWLTDCPGVPYAAGWSMEIWTFDPPTSPEQGAEQDAAHRAGTIHRHPDRVEARATTLATATGDVLHLLRPRNRPPVLHARKVPEADLDRYMEGPLVQVVRVLQDLYRRLP